MSTFSSRRLIGIAIVAMCAVAVADAKCQIFCHQWADSSFTRCDNAEVKCANNLPEGYFCLNFSATRPPVCLDMIPESDASSNPRPRRYKPTPFINYSVDKAPNVDYLQSKETA